MMTLDGTNTYLVRGTESAIVVDPGPRDEAHLIQVSAIAKIGIILLTHRHLDHSEGVERLVELTGAALLDHSAFDTVGELCGVRGADIRMVPTPGHTSDSLCFVLERREESVVFTGDTILGQGTPMIDWPDGDLGEYLESLERLCTLGDFPVLPGHGRPLPSVRATAREYLAHRRDRLDQVRSALAAGDRDPASIVARVYSGIDRSLWPTAELSVRAQLDYLRRAGESP
jgi:glyoxylase-like metal-dependent hydrolase (beta-lactamase superfamily II)